MANPERSPLTTIAGYERSVIALLPGADGSGSTLKHKRRDKTGNAVGPLANLLETLRSQIV
jgi:hypothetical protein